MPMRAFVEACRHCSARPTSKASCPFREGHEFAVVKFINQGEHMQRWIVIEAAAEKNQKPGIVLNPEFGPFIFDGGTKDDAVKAFFERHPKVEAVCVIPLAGESFYRQQTTFAEVK